MARQKWQKLITQIDVIDSKNRVYYDEDNLNLDAELLAFEKQTGIILPVEYKEFLHIFGPGRFGKGIFYVYAPNLEFSQEDISIHLNAGQDGFWKNELMLYMGSDYVTSEESEDARKLFKSAYFFGGSSRQDSLFWNLKTYSELDKSYDIYFVNLGRIPVKIGRSFFEFVHDICFGLNPQTVFPTMLQPYLDEIS
ncbi:MAG: SMI1/KNR4 family protein, partial [Xenococcaceae cyanobacterium]